MVIIGRPHAKNQYSSISTKPIGIYDSGVGGLTVLKVLQQQLPNENFVYFADTAHLPYGNKTPEQIREYGASILTWMQNVADVKMVVAACHTSSAVALPALMPTIAIPIIGAIEPLLKIIKKDDKIGIIATPTAARSLMHEQILRQYGCTETILTIGCPDFVPLIEAGLENGKLDVALLQERAQEYLQPFYTCGLNTLIYGCTHYPLIRDIIEPLLPATVHCIDPAEAIANQVEQDLKQHHLQNKSGIKLVTRFECNKDQAAFQRKVAIVKGS